MKALKLFLAFYSFQNKAAQNTTKQAFRTTDIFYFQVVCTKIYIQTFNPYNILINVIDRIKIRYAPRMDVDGCYSAHLLDVFFKSVLKGCNALSGFDFTETETSPKVDK